MFFSVIVPVFNRPEEIEELLQSLTKQSYSEFEVIIVEDGSDITCEHIVNDFKEKLRIDYYYQENSGQGFSRNFGFRKAQGDYFVVFDSDCIIPIHYFETVVEYLKKDPVDAWGGPDRADSHFTVIQKAINYSMTSPLTTGGIRGRKHQMGPYHPRSFNMGISRNVFEKTGGYKITRMGEDLEFSIRINKMGFRASLIHEAYVFHKRRTNFIQFFAQLHFFGRARINIRKFHPEAVKPVHLLPAFFTASIVVLLIMILMDYSHFDAFLTLSGIFFLIIFTHALSTVKKIQVALLSPLASFIQLTAYGTGLIREFIFTLVTRNGSG